MIIRLSIMLKAPRLGYVKTRLAAEIGAPHALRLYRVLAARTLAAARTLGTPIVIWYSPAEAAAEMQRWLGAEWDFRPQASGDLGARLAAAAHSVPSGDAWLCVGGDCPDLTPEILRQAIEALARSDVVLGPTLDGGYYLVGARAPVPDLFSGMPWSSHALLQATRDRIDSTGLMHEELPVLRDVDTAADARAAGLLT
ncbi:MAG: TIGR04282 family arsenosugar biosynthesis glycosyltransferase [Gemmatimonadota bacterium]